MRFSRTLSEAKSMKKTIWRLLILFVLPLLVISCTKSGELVVLHEVTGPIDTNCYLLYDSQTREAALIDIGGPIDILVAHILDNDLDLKYIFATHVHMDHVEGVPQIQEQFPDALVCYNKMDCEDFLNMPDWIKEHIPEMYAGMMKIPEIKKWEEYDLSIYVNPDINLEDDQIYKLGNLEIRTILSPGHSAGSICFYVGDVLFSGDVLFYRQVGRTDLLGGSKENIVKSVRRLYVELPDTTKVYPGHGEFTDIGTEKTENEEVTEDAVTMKY
jgi:glyoxylase-like metal-dependent hydrolase (beta-lactamase superfamily II)